MNSQTKTELRVKLETNFNNVQPFTEMGKVKAKTHIVTTFSHSGKGYAVGTVKCYGVPVRFIKDIDGNHWHF